MIPHAPDHLPRNTHPHVFEIAVVPHDVLDQLVTRGTAARPHTRGCNAIRQSARRNHLYVVTVDRQLDIRAGQQIIPMDQGSPNESAFLVR